MNILTFIKHVSNISIASRTKATVAVVTVSFFLFGKCFYGKCFYIFDQKNSIFRSVFWSQTCPRRLAQRRYTHHRIALDEGYPLRGITSLCEPSGTRLWPKYFPKKKKYFLNIFQKIELFKNQLFFMILMIFDFDFSWFITKKEKGFPFYHPGWPQPRVLCVYL